MTVRYTSPALVNLELLSTSACDWIVIVASNGVMLYQDDAIARGVVASSSDWPVMGQYVN